MSLAEGVSGQGVEKPDTRFSVKAFLQGLGLSAVILIGVSAWLWSSSESTLEALQGQLAKQTVPIERNDLQPAEGPGAQAASGGMPPAAGMTVLPSGLYAAPVTDLLEKTDVGMLPAVRLSDGLSPFQAYRRNADLAAAAKSKGAVSIVVSDMGLSDVATESAIRSLPPDITLAFSPFGDKLDLYADKARAAGHEIWLGLPMQPGDFLRNDPGSYTLLAESSIMENAGRLHWLLSRMIGYAGVIGTSNGAFFEAQMAAKPILEEIFRRGLGYTDSDPKSPFLAEMMAGEVKAPYARNEVWLDAVPEPSAIELQLLHLEEVAASEGKATAFISPLPVSYRAILQWRETLAQKNIVLVPLSAQSALTARHE